MNKTFLFASLFLLGLTFASAQELFTGTGSTSSVARQNYEDKASQDLRELRREVDAIYEQTPLAGQPALAPYVNAVAAAEQAFADYKIASDYDRAARQKDLESAKANAFRLWRDFRSTRFSGRAVTADSLQDKTP